MRIPAVSPAKLSQDTAVSPIPLLSFTNILPTSTITCRMAPAPRLRKRTARKGLKANPPIQVPNIAGAPARMASKKKVRRDGRSFNRVSGAAIPIPSVFHGGQSHWLHNPPRPLCPARHDRPLHHHEPAQWGGKLRFVKPASPASPATPAPPALRNWRRETPLLFLVFIRLLHKFFKI